MSDLLADPSAFWVLRMGWSVFVLLVLLASAASILGSALRERYSRRERLRRYLALVTGMSLEEAAPLAERWASLHPAERTAAHWYTAGAIAIIAVAFMAGLLLP
jgi:hypothetical protein